MPTVDVTPEVTYIDQADPDTNFGSATIAQGGNVSAGIKNLFLDFDISSAGLLAGSTINSVTMNWYCSARQSAGTATIQKLTGSFLENVVTWNNTAVRASGSILSDIFDVLDIDSTGPHSFAMNATAISEVQANLAGNVYWGIGSIGSPTKRYQIDSDDHPTPAQRPYFTIDYTPPIPAISSFTIGGVGRVYTPDARLPQITMNGTNFLGTMDLCEFIKDGDPNDGKTYAATTFARVSDNECYGYFPVSHVIPGKYNVRVQFDGGDVTSVVNFDVHHGDS